MNYPYSAELDQELAALQDSTTPALQAKWRQVFGTEPPRKMRAGFLRLAIAYRLQEQAFGGLKPETDKALRRLANAIRRSSASSGDGATARAMPTRHLAPGTRLMREWNGSLEAVDVVNDGYTWRGKSYRTLSAVAVAITGTKWSGPKFFGLDRPNDASAPPARIRPRSATADAA
jgi:hypothetical protein